MNIFVTVITAILVFGFLIFIHEFGHYIFARIFKVTIDEFSIGMGPRIFSHTSKKTGIKYSIAALPIGGFVAMAGESVAEEGTEEYERWQSDPNTFDKKPAWQRFIITAAGAAVNVLAGFIAVMILSFFINIGGTRIAQFCDSNGKPLDITTSETGLKLGDEIISIDGKRVDTAEELSYEIMRRGVEPVDVVVLREGKEALLKDVSFPTVTASGQKLGVPNFFVFREEKTLGSMMNYTWSRSLLTVRMCWESIIDLISGRYSFAAVSGPVGISEALGEAAQSEAPGKNLLELVALISINLGIMNLIPFPALDGGRLITVTAEMITRKRIPPRIESIINFVGLAFLLGLSAIILVKDVIQLII